MENSRQVGDHKKPVLEETKKIINCLNCTEMLRSFADIQREDPQDDEKGKRYFQLQNRYLAFKEQLYRRTRPEEISSTVPDLTSRTQDSSTATTAFSTLLNPFNETPELTQAAISQKPDQDPVYMEWWTPV